MDGEDQGGYMPVKFSKVSFTNLIPSIKIHCENKIKNKISIKMKTKTEAPQCISRYYHMSDPSFLFISLIG